MTMKIRSLLELKLNAQPGKTHLTRVENALALMAEATLAPGKLSVKEKLLLLAATCCARRNYKPAKEAVRLALTEGATASEVEEVLLSCFVSRGPLVYLGAREALDSLLNESDRPESQDESIQSEKLSDTLEKFLSYFGTVPLWAKTLSENTPALIEGHQLIREVVFSEGHASRKLKELVFVAINCADRYDYGIELHTKASVAAGASEKEILETMAISFLEGGVVSCIEGVKHYLGEGENY